MLRPIPLPAPVTSAVFKFAAKANSSRAIERLRRHRRPRTMRHAGLRVTTRLIVRDRPIRGDRYGRTEAGIVPPKQAIRPAIDFQNKEAAAITGSPRLSWVGRGIVCDLRGGWRLSVPDLKLVVPCPRSANSGRPELEDAKQFASRYDRRRLRTA